MVLLAQAKRPCVVLLLKNFLSAYHTGNLTSFMRLLI